jgi:hypothetical protein
MKMPRFAENGPGLRAAFWSNRVLVLSCLASLGLAGCSSASGNSAPQSGRVVHGTERGSDRWDGDVRRGETPLVYVADQDVDCKYELYIKSPSERGGSIKLNPPLPIGGDIDVFAITSLGESVVYVADQRTADRFELFIVELAAPGVAATLSAPLAIGRDVREFALGPDGKVVYRADHEVDDVWELYVVDIASPANASKLNAPLEEGEHVLDGYSINADGTKAFYRVGRDDEDVGQAYVVEIAAPGISRRVHAARLDGSDGPHASSGSLSGRTSARPPRASALTKCAQWQQIHRAMR